MQLGSLGDAVARRLRERSSALARSFGESGTRGLVWRYGGAALLAIGAVALTRLLASQLAGLNGALPLLAVCLAGLRGGLGPGLLAAAIVVASYFPLLARGAASFGITPEHPTARFLVFALSVLLVAVATGAARSLSSARARLDDLAHQHLAALGAITESLSEGVYAVDVEGRLTFLNPAASRMLGWSQEELLGKPVHAFLRARTPEGLPVPAERCPAAAVLRTGRSYRDDRDHLTRKDGSLLAVSCTASPIWRNGTVQGVVLAFRDFTEHRFFAEASRLLEEGDDPEATLHAVACLAARHLGDCCAVAVLDPGRRPRLAALEATGAGAAAAADLFETARNLGGAALSSCFKPDRYPIDLEAEHGLGKVLRTGQPELLPDVATCTGQDGARPQRGIMGAIPVASFLAVPMRARGRLVGAMGFAVTGGARRFDEQDLAAGTELARRCAYYLDNAELYRSAQEAKRVREDALAVVAHDLKGPLSNVLLSAKTLERLAPEGPKGDVIRKMSRLILRSADRMSRLAGDLLDFASIEAGRLSIVRERHEAASIAQEAVEAFQPTAEQRGVSVALDVAPGTLAIECDRDRIAQVLSNLLSNAVQVSPEGGKVTVSVVESEGQALFSVRDEGPGIASEELPGLFDRYARGRAAAQYKGTGLGLAIARNIVELHGGRIWVETKIGAGSTFRFRLPASRPELGSDVLVVDDDADIRAVLREALELEGHHVALAANGREAWEWLQSARAPGLVLLDLMMPVMNGAELLGLIRTDDRLKSVPVVLVTAFGALAEPIAARSNGFLPKPLELDQILDLASRYCGAPAGAAPAGHAR